MYKRLYEETLVEKRRLEDRLDDLRGSQTETADVQRIKDDLAMMEEKNEELREATEASLELRDSPPERVVAIDLSEAARELIREDFTSNMAELIGGLTPEPRRAALVIREHETIKTMAVSSGSTTFTPASNILENPSQAWNSGAEASTPTPFSVSMM